MVPGFFVVSLSRFSLFQILKLFQVGIHPLCTLPLHLGGHTAVDVQSKYSGGMAQISPTKARCSS